MNADHANGELTSEGEGDWYDKALDLQAVGLLGPRKTPFDVSHICNWAVALELLLENSNEAMREKRPQEGVDPDLPTMAECLEEAGNCSKALATKLETLFGGNWRETANLDEEARAERQAKINSDMQEMLLHLIKTGYRHLYRFWRILECSCPELQRERLTFSSSQFTYTADMILGSLGLLMFTEEDAAMN